MEGAGASVTIDAHRDEFRAEMARLRSIFLAATAALTRSAEWRETDAAFSTVTDTVIEHARVAGLVMACQADPGWGSSAMMEGPDRLILGSGRPVLLIPNSGRASLPARRITVAWNDRREAARAAYDALPLLERADSVNVVWVDPERERRVAGDVPGADLCTALARSGVRCEAGTVSSADGNVGAALLSAAGAYGSDLLVLGGYGHSRFREMILGGATRHVLANMNLPVLLSH